MNGAKAASESFHGRSAETEVLDVFGVHIRILDASQRNERRAQYL